MKENRTHIDQLIWSMYSRTSLKTNTLIRSIDDLNVCNDKGQYPLHEAIYLDDQDVILALLDRGADINHMSKDGTPLFIAAKLNSTHLVSLLLENGAEPEGLDSAGCSALIEAVQHKNHKMIKLLLEKGADPDRTPTSGLSPINIAVLDGNLAVIKLLHKHKETA